MTAVDDARVRSLWPTPAVAYPPVAAPTNVGTTTVSAPRPKPLRHTVTTGELTTIVSPRTQPSLENRKLWERRYSRRIRLSDALVVLSSVALTAAVEALSNSTTANALDPWGIARVSILTAAVWLTLLSLFRTRAPEFMAVGAMEYTRVAYASGFAFGVLASAFVVLQLNGLRWQLMVSLPVGLFALLMARWSWRRWLRAQRRFGHYASRTIVVGDEDDVDYVLRRLDRDEATGYIVVGTMIEGQSVGNLIVDKRSYPILGNLNNVASVAREFGADTIIVASTPPGEPDYVRRLSWELEGTAADLILSSRLVDVAGPRISLRPVDGLPLIAVKIPTFEGGQHIAKRGLDIILSSCALLVVSVLVSVIALAIKLDSPGPVFFRQTRVGRDGREFGMVKFRSMRVDAEEQLATLQLENEGAGPLFKMKSDPRVTRVGRILRKFSIDELPQFWNVLIGDMSVVGPRPPLPSEVTSYGGTVFRRLYINPGITGLWQVSGRSDLSWDESIKLDLRYVENWSLTTDLMIMWRTVQVMLQPKGAY